MPSVFGLLLILVSSVYGTNVWVSTSGSNKNPGTPQQPVQTVSYAYSLLKGTSPSSINNIYIQAGNYGYNNLLALKPINANFIATGGTVVFSCGSNNGPFVYWGSTSVMYYWYNTQFTGISFESCSGELASIAVSGSNGGGMNFVFNNVDFNGAMVYFECTGSNSASCNITMTDVDFANTFDPNSSAFTALSVYEALGLSVTSSSFTNVGLAFSAVYVQDVNVASCGITSNNAPTSVFDIQQCNNVYVTDIQINANSFQYSMIVVDSCDNVTFNDFQVFNNSGVGTGDTYLFNIVSSDVSFNNVGIQSNTATGMVELYSSVAAWNDVVIQDNASGQYTVVLGQASKLTMTNTQIQDNTAYYGGALAVFSSSLIATYSTFNGNTATQVGGALYAASATVSWSDVTISNNGAETGGAGYCQNTQFSDNDCSFTNNVSYDGSAPLQC